MKNNKGVVLITSIICLLPIIFSIIVYESLPMQVAIHWNGIGVADNYAHKSVAAFGLPILFLVINIISNMIMFKGKIEGQAKAIRFISIWLIPFLAFTVVPITLIVALGAEIPVLFVSKLFIGFIFVIVGNYLPKSRQNYIFGIKLPWTLNSSDNWKSTHRFAGYLYIAVGIIIMAVNFIFIDLAIQMWIILGLIVVLVIVPIIYSYKKYRRDSKNSDNT